MDDPAVNTTRYLLNLQEHVVNVEDESEAARIGVLIPLIQQVRDALGGNHGDVIERLLTRDQPAARALYQAHLAFFFDDRAIQVPRLNDHGLASLSKSLVFLGELIIHQEFTLSDQAVLNLYSDILYGMVYSHTLERRPGAGEGSSPFRATLNQWPNVPRAVEVLEGAVAKHHLKAPYSLMRLKGMRLDGS